MNIHEPLIHTDLGIIAHKPGLHDGASMDISHFDGSDQFVVTFKDEFSRFINNFHSNDSDFLSCRLIDQKKSSGKRKGAF